MTEKSSGTIDRQKPRQRESFPRLQAVMPVTKLSLKPTLQIVDGRLAAVVLVPKPA
jgi:hypothetical protein